MRWDSPEHYGVACKRTDARETTHRSPFNSRRTMATALAQLITDARAGMLLVSYNDEAWITPEAIIGWLRDAGHERVELLAFDSRRYVGARIGIYNPQGQRVGNVSHTRNTEYVFVAGPNDRVAAAVAAVPAPQGGETA